MPERLAIDGGQRAVPPGIETKWPDIREEDKAAVLRVLERGQLGGAYAPEALGLQKEFAAYIGRKYCLALNSGTAALHCALYAAGLQPGDEVITSAFSFVASPMAVLQNINLPVFVDIDPKTFNLDVSQIEDKITDRTRALLPVHIHGQAAEMDEVNAIARKHNLVVIEDAAQAHGALYRGKRVGTLGAMACYSLNFTKNLPGGEGGFFLCDDQEYFERADQLRIFGERVRADETRSYVAHGIGWNYRTQELPAAFARSQLQRLDEYNTTAQRNGALLSRELAKIRGLEPPFAANDRTHIYHKYRLRLRPELLGIKIPTTEFRTRVLNAIQAEGVPAMLWQTTSLPAYPLFQSKEGFGGGYPWSLTAHGREMKYRAEDYPETQKLLDNSIIVGTETNPLYVQSQEYIESWVTAFRKVFDNLDAVLEAPLKR
jgi:perosamine synthetase